VSAFLDTDVLVDCLRGHPPAQAWLSHNTGAAFSVPGIVAMELVVGCPNQTEFHRMKKLLASFHVVWSEATDEERAYELLWTHRLASGLSIPDSLIAAMALARKAKLYTFNRKHFRHIVGLDVEEPYPR
jgi:predicted nucleic acid-binding protein